MRGTILIRCGIASLLIGGGIGGMFAAGCGGDDNGATNNGQDSGPDGSNQPGDDGSTTNPDSGPATHPDGGDAGPDAAPAPAHSKLLLVHASAGAPPLRFCFGISTGATDAGNAVTVPPTFPAPNTTIGLPPGTGGSAADSTMDLANYNVTVYAIPSAALTAQTPDAGASELTCKQLVGAAAVGVDAGGLDPNEVFNLGTMPAGTLADETTTLALVTGCAPGINDPHDSVFECPSGYSSATGDLGLSFVKLDTTTSFDGGALGAQFVYASNPFSLIAQSAGDSTGAVNAGFYTSTLVPVEAGTPDAGEDAGDAGGDAGDAAVEASAPVFVPSTAFTLVAPNVTNGQLAPATLVSVPLSSLDFAGHSGFTAGVTGADGGPAFALSLPLPTIEALSNPGSTATTSEFAGGGGFVFVLVGDPSLPNFIGADGGALPQDAGGAFNTQVAHFLAFPVNPPFGN